MIVVLIVIRIMRCLSTITAGAGGGYFERYFSGAAANISATMIASAQGVGVRIGGDRKVVRDRSAMRGDKDRGDRDRREMRESRDEYRDHDRGLRRERRGDRVIVIKRRYRRY